MILTKLPQLLERQYSRWKKYQIKTQQLKQQLGLSPKNFGDYNNCMYVKIILIKIIKVKDNACGYYVPTMLNKI